MNKGSSEWEKAQEGRELENRRWGYLKPVLEELHQKVNRRLVKTMLDLVLVILMHRQLLLLMLSCFPCCPTPASCYF